LGFIIAAVEVYSANEGFEGVAEYLAYFEKAVVFVVDGELT